MLLFNKLIVLIFFYPPSAFKPSNMHCPGSDYMSKLSYQESLREQMAASNLNSAGLKPSGMECVRCKRWVSSFRHSAWLICLASIRNLAKQNS